MSYRVLQPIFDGKTTYAIGQVVADETFSPFGVEALLDVGALALWVEPRTHPLPIDDTSVGAGSVSVPLSLNSATEEQLIDLPHIGSVTAGRLLAQRPYDDLEDARQAAGLSASKWAELLPLVDL
jgi:hypothetical protein